MDKKNSGIFYKQPWFAAIAIVLVFVMGLSAAVNALWQNTIGSINKVAPQSSPSLQEMDQENLLNEIEEEVLEHPIPYDKDVTNILLLGIDSRDKKKIDERSDAMMILTVNKGQRKLKLTSLQRDMLVPMPGMDMMDKLNHANVYGGPEYVMKTIEGILRIKLDRYVVVNMKGMEDIVDVVGGITLNITEEQLPFVNKNIQSTNSVFTDTPKVAEISKTGKQEVNGRQAVAYARNRSTLGGDYDRMRYQRDVIQAILDKFLELRITDKLKTMNEGLQYITTNLTENEMLGMLQSVLPIMDQKIETLQIPIEGYHTHYSGNAWLNLCDFNGMIPLLHEFIYGKQFPFDPVPEIPGAPNSSETIEEQPIDDWVTDTGSNGSFVEEPYVEDPYVEEPSVEEPSVEDPSFEPNEDPSDIYIPSEPSEITSDITEPVEIPEESSVVPTEPEPIITDTDPVEESMP